MPIIPVEAINKTKTNRNEFIDKVNTMIHINNNHMNSSNGCPSYYKGIKLSVATFIFGITMGQLCKPMHWNMHIRVERK